MVKVRSNNKKTSKKNTRKTSRKTTRKTSRKTIRKTTRKTTRKTSHKTTRKTSHRNSKKINKMRGGGVAKIINTKNSKKYQIEGPVILINYIVNWLEEFADGNVVITPFNKTIALNIMKIFAQSGNNTIYQHLTNCNGDVLPIDSDIFEAIEYLDTRKNLMLGLKTNTNINKELTEKNAKIEYIKATSIDVCQKLELDKTEIQQLLQIPYEGKSIKDLMVENPDPQVQLRTKPKAVDGSKNRLRHVIGMNPDSFLLARASNKKLIGGQKNTRKTSRKTTRKTSHKTMHKTSRKTIRKTSRKTMRKTSRKTK
jgi:hypothetical protein